MNPNIWPRVYVCPVCGAQSNASVHCVEEEPRPKGRASFIVSPDVAERWIEACGQRRARKGKFIWIDGYRFLADGWVEIFYREGWTMPEDDREVGIAEDA